MTSYFFGSRKTLQRYCTVASKVLFCYYGLQQFTPSASPLWLEALDEEEAPPKIYKAPKLKAFFSKIREADYPHEVCAFIDESPSSYHAVAAAKRLLQHHGFQEIVEKDSWSDQVRPGGKYFVVRDDTSGASMIAFAVGQLWKPGNPFVMVATHVDSPCLKVKPVSHLTLGNGTFAAVGVETYGGGSWHTWLDRDLSLAGRVFLRTKPDIIESRLVQVDEPILRIPSLAMHYDQSNPLKIDKEFSLIPISNVVNPDIPPSPADLAQHNPEVADDYEWGQVTRGWATSPAHRRHARDVVSCVAKKLSVPVEDVLDFDLHLYDTQKSAIGGLFNDFIFAPRLDNLMMTFCALQGLTESLASPDALASEPCIRLISLFDNEEISSKTSLSGASNFLPSTLQRLSQSTFPAEENLEPASALPRSLARSFLISADMIHGLHPLFPSLHETAHRPILNSGIVMYSAARRTFSKNTPGHALLSELACRTTNPEHYAHPPRMQFFVQPNNVNCGQTLGPLLATRLGVRTAEVGNSQLAMHSIREVCGARDVENAVRFFRGFWEGYGEGERTMVLGLD